MLMPFSFGSASANEPVPEATSTPTATPTESPVSSSSPSPTPVVSAQPTPPASGEEMVSGIIVKYRADVAAAQPVGPNLGPVGAELVTSADIAVATPLAEGLTTLKLVTPVDVESAEMAAQQLEQDPRVLWAEPDRMRYVIADPVRPASSTVDITVSGIDGSATKSNAFTYSDGAPTVISLSVTMGPVTGGTSVVLSGTNLVGTTSLTVGGSLATLVSSTSTTLTFTTPAKLAGTYDVVVQNALGSATLSAAFTYIAAPTISSIAPIAGGMTGGQLITITGTNLALTSSIRFGSATVTPSSVSATSVEVTTPQAAAAGAVNVVLTTPGGSVTRSSGFTYAAAPTVSTLSVTVGGTSGGTSVTLTGTNLAFITSVSFDGAAASVVSKTATSAVVTTPAHVAGAVDLAVTTLNGSVTKTSAFTYVGSPSASSLNISAGALAGGLVVTLSGTNLTGATSVAVGGTAAGSISSTSSTVRFTTPAKAAGTYNVVVSSPFGSSTLPNAFTYLPVPTVSSLSQSLGSSAGGQSVTLTGTALGSTTSVTFGGTQATITARTATSVTVTTPTRRASTTAVAVVVTSPGGSATRASAFTFATPPSLSTVSPVTTSGTGGGTSITISGANLLPIKTVSVGGVAATMTAKTATSISLVTPTRAAGVVGITVSGDTGTATKNSALTYELRAPVITSMTPSSGSVDGGSTVVVSGSNLGDASAATFGGVPATILSKTTTSITLLTPAKIAGSANLVVFGPGGNSTSVRTYTYVVPAPTVTSVSPSVGRLSGGEVITIRGTRLAAVTAVKFGTSSSTAASGTSLTRISDTELRVTTPAGTLGAKSVYVIAPSGTATKSNGYTYVGVPKITTVSPSSGSSAGGSTVVINGTALANLKSVTIGGALATVSTTTDTRITAIVPAGTPGGRAIVVVTAGGTATKFSGFTYRVVRSSARAAAASVPVSQASPAVSVAPVASAAPVVSAAPVAQSPVPVAPPVQDAQSELETSFAVGPTVTDCAASTADRPVQRCYDDNDLDAGVSLDGEINYADAYLSASDKTKLIVDVVPYVNISNDSWLTRSETHVQAFFDVNNDQLADVVLVAPNATVTVNASVAAGVFDWSGGQWVQRSSACSTTITRAYGTHFAFPAESNNQWWQFRADWSCLFGAQATDVDVITFLKDELNPAYTDYAPDGWLGEGMNLAGAMQNPPTMTSLTPSSGGTAGGTSVTISGTGMADVSDVSFGGTSGTILSRTSTQVVVSTPRVASMGAVEVRVTGPGGSRALAGGFTFTSSAPTISSVSPNAGATAGGTTVTITGTNLSGITNVRFGTASATILSKTATSIVVSSPAEGSGFVPTSPTETAFTNGTLWGLTGAFGTKANTAWNLTQGSSDVIVAVLDTGITAHPDLGAQVPGYDMISSTSISNDGNGRDNDPSDPGDWCPTDGSSSSWHGTHVAGTVNAAINGAGSVGVAPNVKVQNVRVLGRCGGSMSDIAAAIYWAAGGSVSGVPVNANPADVISLSLGGGGACSATEQNAINFAHSRGIVVTVAAGNENSDASTSSPGNCNNVITVAATDSSGKRASFSNYGSYIEIAAPGVGIYSTVNTGSTTPSGYSYQSWNGTSMATPHVAGVVALMLSRDQTLTPAQVLQRIQSTATAFGGGVCDSAAPSKTCGSGVINAGLAVQ